MAPCTGVRRRTSPTPPAGSPVTSPHSANVHHVPVIPAPNPPPEPIPASAPVPAPAPVSAVSSEPPNPNPPQPPTAATVAVPSPPRNLTYADLFIPEAQAQEISRRSSGSFPPHLQQQLQQRLSGTFAPSVSAAPAAPITPIAVSSGSTAPQVLAPAVSAVSGPYPPPQPAISAAPTAATVPGPYPPVPAQPVTAVVPTAAVQGAFPPPGMAALAQSTPLTPSAPPSVLQSLVSASTFTTSPRSSGTFPAQPAQPAPYSVPSSRTIPLGSDGTPPQSHPIMLNAAAAPVSPNATVNGLPANWEVRVDTRTHRYYYVDHLRRQTFWDLPRDVISAIPLPPGWEARIDPRTGKLYYLNHSNKTTHWDYPFAPHPATASIPAASGGSGGTAKPDDPRVLELIAMGFSREAAAAAAIANPVGTVPELVELVLLRAKQQGHEVNIPPPVPAGGGGGPVDESKVCKVCMENEIDVVILKCGHMCVCLQCGKKLHECPICRGRIVELLRVFKS